MVPIEVDGDFKTDGSGNGSDTRRIQGGHWSAVYASCQCAGSGQWVAGKLGKAQFFQQGANVLLGPIILKPGEQAQVRVVGATASVQGSIVYWGWQGESTDGSDLASVVPSIESAGSLTGSVPISLTGPVSVTDGGLAGSIATANSQMQLVSTTNLTSGGAVNIQAGRGFAQPYLSGAASWQMIISGLGGTNFGLRILQTCYDNTGNALCVRQRDSAQVTMDMIIGSGILDTQAMQWAITLPPSAPAGCKALLYMTAMTLQDNWYDAGIYENTSSQAGLFSPGFDGALTRASNTIPASGNQTYQLPTYRGPIQLGIQMSQAGHLALYEFDYLGNSIGTFTNVPVSSSGQQQQAYTLFLPAMNNKIVLFNDSSSATNTFFMEARAIKDLMT